MTLALRTQGLHISHWESVMDEALHAIRSLLCTATNTTPHERMFNHMRKSFYGHSLPIWLSSPGPVLLKKFNQVSKYSPAVEIVDLIDAGPQYARIRLSDGRESTVSLRHLAPYGDDRTDNLNETLLDHRDDTNDNDVRHTTNNDLSKSEVSVNEEDPTDIESSQPPDSPTHTCDTNNGDHSRRLSYKHTHRAHRPPKYLEDYVTYK